MQKLAVDAAIMCWTNTFHVDVKKGSGHNGLCLDKIKYPDSINILEGSQTRTDDSL